MDHTRTSKDNKYIPMVKCKPTPAVAMRESPVIYDQTAMSTLVQGRCGIGLRR